MKELIFPFEKEKAFLNHDLKKFLKKSFAPKRGMYLGQKLEQIIKEIL